MIAIAMFHQGKREQLHGEKGIKFLWGTISPREKGASKTNFPMKKGLSCLEEHFPTGKKTLKNNILNV
jgi:hypothetical protein